MLEAVLQALVFAVHVSDWVAFNNYVDIILPFFHPLPPHLVHVVIEWSIVKQIQKDGYLWGWNSNCIYNCYLQILKINAYTMPTACL